MTSEEIVLAGIYSSGGPRRCGAKGTGFTFARSRRLHNPHRNLFEPPRDRNLADNRPEGTTFHPQVIKDSPVRVALPNVPLWSQALPDLVGCF